MNQEDETERSGFTPDEEYTELVFRDDDNVDDMYLTFGVATEEYGIGIGYVTEIVSMQHIVHLPESAPAIKGVINLRGKVIPVMDLRLRFGLAPKEYTERTVIIVLSVEDVPVGLVVDHVSEVLEIPPTHIDTAVRMGGQGASLVRGFGKQANRFAAIVDVERMLAGQLLPASIH
jgi:purine-binding chemotaxis protein CheW